MLTTTLITLTIILERLLASGTLTTALAAIFRKALSTLGPVSYTHLTLPTNREV